MLREIKGIFFIFGISKVLFKFSYDFMDSFMINKFNIIKYNIIDKFFIFSFFILCVYNSLLIYSLIKLTYFHIKEYYYSKLRFDNMFDIILYDDKLDPCSICFDEFSENDKICRLIQCTHYYHYYCINTWYSSQINIKELSCPICRATVN